MLKGFRYTDVNPSAMIFTPEAPPEAKETEKTVADLVAAYLSHLQANREQTTYRDAASALRLRILPKFGRLALWQLTPEDLEAAHREDPHPIAANRAMQYLKAAWNRGERLRWVPPNRNPLKFLGDFTSPEPPRSRVLSEVELPLVLAEIDRQRQAWREGPASWAAILLVLLTGARHREILTLKWSEVQDGALHLERSKTGRKVIFLSKAAVEVLDEVSRREWFHDNKPGPHIRALADIVPEARVFAGVDMRRTWEKIREIAGCPDATIHDLRRTYASRLLASGKVELVDVAKALGQKTLRITAFTYTPLTAKRQQAIADIGSRMILAPNQEE